MIVMVMVMVMDTIHSYLILSYSFIRKQHRAHRTHQKAADLAGKAAQRITPDHSRQHSTARDVDIIFFIRDPSV